MQVQSRPRGSPKTGHRGSLQNRPTITIIQDVDFGARAATLGRCEQCLERGKEAASHSIWAARLVAAQDPEDHGVRRETAADYLRAAGIGLRPPGGWGRSAPAKPAKEVTPDPQPAKPANRAEVIPDSGAVLASPPAATVNASAGRSACEPHRETIELELSKGRNAKGIWQDLVDRSGFAGGYHSVKRLIVALRGKPATESRAVT